MQVYRKINGKERVVETMVISNVSDTHVTGTVQRDNEKGASTFNVKRHPNNCFYRGSGSGKIAYYFK